MSYTEFLINDFPKYYMPNGTNRVVVYEKDLTDALRVSSRTITFPDHNGGKLRIHSVLVHGDHLYAAASVSDSEGYLLRYDLIPDGVAGEPYEIHSSATPFTSLAITAYNFLYALRDQQGSSVAQEIMLYNIADTPQYVRREVVYQGVYAIASPMSGYLFLVRRNKIEHIAVRNTDGAFLVDGRGDSLTGGVTSFYTEARDLHMEGTKAYLLTKNGNNPYKIYNYTRNISTGAFTASTQATNEIPSQSLTGIDVNDEDTIHVGDADSLAYVYLLHGEADADGAATKDNIILKIFDGKDAAHSLLFECSVNAARGGGYPNLHGRITGDILHYREFQEAGRVRSQGTEWLVGVWTDPK